MSGPTRPLLRPAEAQIAAPARTFTFGGEVSDTMRSIAIERPVQVSFGDVPFGVMMVTPQDLDDFAYGFSLTEGVIATAADVRGIAVVETSEGLHLRVDLTGATLHAHLARKRALSGRTSCGLCGIEDLAALDRATRPAGPAPTLALRAIERAVQDLERHQPLNADTRAIHGAAWCDHAGTILHAREDVGRHNALDKLVGALLRAGVAPGTGFVIITSRASFEMVEKVAVFGCRTLVAISAPTALALERAMALDITLAGVARRDAVTVFHGAERIVTQGSVAAAV